MVLGYHAGHDNAVHQKSAMNVELDDLSPRGDVIRRQRRIQPRDARAVYKDGRRPKGAAGGLAGCLKLRLITNAAGNGKGALPERLHGRGVQTVHIPAFNPHPLVLKRAGHDKPDALRTPVTTAICPAIA